MTIPIIADSKRIGHLDVCYRDLDQPTATPFAVEETEMLVSIAEQIGNAVSRQNITAALTRSEERHRSLFETMAQGVIYQDPDLRVISFNPAAAKLLGIAEQQLRGRINFDPRFRTIRKDGTDFPAEEHPSVVALRTGREVRDVIMGFYNPGMREQRWVKVNAMPRCRAGENHPYQVYSTLEEITTLKETEEALLHRIRMEELVTEISTRFINLEVGEIDAEIWAAMVKMARIMGANRSYVYLLEQKNRLVRYHYWQSADIAGRVPPGEVGAGDVAWWLGALENRDFFQVDQLAKLPPEAKSQKRKSLPQRLTIRALVPFRYKDSLLGFLGFDSSSRKKGWAGEDLAMLKVLGDIVTLALERKKTDEKLQQSALRQKRENFLYQFRRMCRESSDLEFLFEWAAAWLGNHLRATRAGVWRWRGGKGQAGLRENA